MQKNHDFWTFEFDYQSFINHVSTSVFPGTLMTWNCLRNWEKPKSCASFVCRQQHGVETQTSNSFIGWRSQKRRFWVDVKTLLATYTSTYCINVYIYIYTNYCFEFEYIYIHTHPFVNLCLYYIWLYMCIKCIYVPSHRPQTCPTWKWHIFNPKVILSVLLWRRDSRLTPGMHLG